MKATFAGLLWAFILLPALNAQTVNGSIDNAFAVGKWKESREGVSLFCAHITTTKEITKGNSGGVCFLSEAQPIGKDSVQMATNLFVVTSWGAQELTAETEFYADKSGNQTTKTDPNALRFVFRLVLNFDAHQMTKFVAGGNGNTTGYHLTDQ